MLHNQESRLDLNAVSKAPHPLMCGNNWPEPEENRSTNGMVPVDRFKKIGFAIER